MKKTRVAFGLMALTIGIGIWWKVVRHELSTPPAPAVASAQDIETMKIQWFTRLTSLSNEYTERTYQCMTEMYSFAFTPVSSGPICRESCKLLDQVNTMAKTAPSYIENPQQYDLGPSKVCEVKPPAKSRPKSGLLRRNDS